MRVLITASLVFVLVTGASGQDDIYADYGAYTAKRFCYALSAGSNCDFKWMSGFKMSQIENGVGASLRGSDSPYEDACTAGDNRFWDQKLDEGHDIACAAAWAAVGPDGDEFAGIVS